MMDLICFQDSSDWSICLNQSYIKQLRVHHTCHQSFYCFLGTTNVGHEPSQVISTLDSFICCDLVVFAKAKPLIQLFSRIFDSPRDFVFTKYNLRGVKGSPVRDQ